MKRMKLDQTNLEYAVAGGCILGGGGGGDPEQGRLRAQIAVDYSDLYLTDISELDDDDLIICASSVGAPNAANRYQTAQHLVRAVELIQENTGLKIAGVITNENGGKATVNGWVQAAVMGLTLVDAPCNGRAHPTGVMGSLNLQKDPGYVSVQAAVGGNPQTGHYVECLVTGSIDSTAKLVRAASIEAGGLVAVARNPVTVKYAKQHCAVGGISHAIEVGKAHAEGLETSAEKAIENVAALLGGTIWAKGSVRDFSIKTEGGFDVGCASVDGAYLTFWNEYMTLEKGGERLATFPELIMTFDAKTGAPLPTASIRESLEVVVISAPAKNLRLSSTMFEADLMKTVETVIKKEIIKYLPKRQ